MKKRLLLLLTLICHSLIYSQTVTYNPSTSIIANPERGVHKWTETDPNYATQVGFNNLSVATLNGFKNSTDKVTVVYRNFRLDPFMNSDINTTYLENMQRDFDNVRTAGLKMIVRFFYSADSNATTQQPTKSQILTHISQLSSILTQNKDVIFSFQAGFLGTWGEWYYMKSTEFGDQSTISDAQWANRKEIIDAMLAATPSDMFIQLRTPAIKKKLYGDTPLTDQTAYQNTPNARCGLFNDSFLNIWGDSGTYPVGQCVNPVGTLDYNYAVNETKYVPMTGETSGLNLCDINRSKGPNAINEMDLTNWTIINRDYHGSFWFQLLNTEDYNIILSRLGYRFVLNSSTITTNGSNFDLTINLTNEGFARPFKARNVYLVLKNTSTNAITTQQINTDIRTWESTVTLSQNFDLSLSGTYQLYLWMPDSDSVLSTNPNYSIQVANTNTWEATTGYNNLQQTVTLSTLGVDEILYNNKIEIYPNPASDVITIQFNNPNKQNIEIYNSIGKLVKTTTASSNDKIDVSELSNGIYFIRLKDLNSVTKFIKS